MEMFYTSDYAQNFSQYCCTWTVCLSALDINEIGLPSCNNTAPSPDWLASVSKDTGRFES